MVVGLVSGTGAGFVETLVRSTVGGWGALVACCVHNDSVWAPRFEVSCALTVAVASVFANERCNVSRSHSAKASGGSAEEESDAMKKESEYNPASHPRQSASANNAPVMF
jgi:hypothetical protein